MTNQLMSWRGSALAFTIAAAGLCCSSSALAFSDDEARRAILDLREQVRQMNEQNVQARLSLAGQLEALKHEQATIRGELEKLRWEADLAKRASETTAAAASTQVADPQEQAAFDAAMAQFRSGQYKEAVNGFTTFLQSYPASPLVPEARFYRGSGLYASKDFKGSIQGLQAMVQASPQDSRAPDALLVIAANQIELNDMAGAKTTLQRIVKDYPEATAAETAKSRLKLLQ
jgi:tol-pal system protein YbgF